MAATLASTAALALDAEGRILALRVDSLANLGAYATPAGVVIQLLIGPWVSTSIYDISVIDIGIKGVLTHTSPTGAYRGAGRPEAIYIIERLMDAAARQLRIDPRRAAPAQHDPAGADAVSQSRWTRRTTAASSSGDGPGARARGLARLRRAGRSLAKSAAVCAGAAWRRSSNGPAPTCSRRPSRSS